MTFVAWPYDFSTATLPPPTSNQIRLDAAHPYAAATTLWARNLTTSGIDVRVVLLAVPVGATLYLQDTNESARFGRFETTGPAIDHTDYVAFPVIWTANGDPLLNNQGVQLLIITEATLPPPTSGPGALTLEEAKEHLRILDSDHDADVTAKLHEAEAIIATYLIDNPAPDPLHYRAAVKWAIAHLYENRGEDLVKDEAFWQALDRLLCRHRPPVLA